jgi:PqqD family protein of HPr-rel-A system
MKWRMQSEGRFYDANESTVVYFDSHSGDTHLITDFAAFLIQQFSQQPLGIEELVSRISAHVDASDGAEFKDDVLTVLNELVSLDILKRD